MVGIGYFAQMLVMSLVEELVFIMVIMLRLKVKHNREVKLVLHFSH